MGTPATNSTQVPDSQALLYLPKYYYQSIFEHFQNLNCGVSFAQFNFLPSIRSIHTWDCYIKANYNPKNIKNCFFNIFKNLNGGLPLPNFAGFRTRSRYLHDWFFHQVSSRLDPSFKSYCAIRHIYIYTHIYIYIYIHI